MKTQSDDVTHFGYKTVKRDEKESLVANVFHSVAAKYDLMNDVMSFGMHRLWKKITIDTLAPKSHDILLDLASGTGDLAKTIVKRLGKEGRLVMSDINESMLQMGVNKLTDAGCIDSLSAVQADAEKLPFLDNQFNGITIAFGLRNVTNKEYALREAYRVLKPGGKLLVLEFSKPVNKTFSQLYDLYSTHVIPKMGEMITKDRDSYEYLIESIRMHPDQETLKQMMVQSEFEDVRYENLTGGVVALHVGYKY